jgi:hypothetical protein
MVGALAAAAAVAGCGGESEEPKPAATPAAPEAAAVRPGEPAAKKQPRPAALRKTEVVESTELPVGFPTDVPRYPNAEVQSSRTSPKIGMSVVMSSSDPVEQVSQFLADSLAAEGWSTDIREAPKGKVILADKGERTTVTQVVSAKDGTTRIRVLVTQFAR